jgi:hypothetical protein
MVARLAGRMIRSKFILFSKFTPDALVIPDKSTSTSEVIVSRMQVKSALLSVPVRVSFATLTGRIPASKIRSDKVPEVSTWRVKELSLFIKRYSSPHAC